MHSLLIFYTALWSRILSPYLFINLVKKLKHRYLSNLPQITQLAVGESKLWARESDSRSYLHLWLVVCEIQPHKPGTVKAMYVCLWCWYNLRKQKILTHSDIVIFKVWVVYIAFGGFEVDELLPPNTKTCSIFREDHDQLDGETSSEV